MTRRPRHTRPRKKPPFRLSKEDVEILLLLARYRYLRTPSIVELTGRQHRAVNRSLLRLFSHSYLSRVSTARPAERNFYWPEIYELDHKGFQLLKEFDEEDFAKLGLKYDRVTTMTYANLKEPARDFPHSMMICDMLSSIEVGINQSDCEFIGWQEILDRAGISRLEFKVTISYTHPDNRYQRVEAAIRPDALFGIRYPDGQVSFFAVEAERYSPKKVSTLTRSSFLKKSLAYDKIIREGIYKDVLKIPNLRLLVIAPKKAQIENLINLTKEVVGGTNAFLFHDVPTMSHLNGPPPPFPELFNAKWKRAGRESVRLDLTD